MITAALALASVAPPASAQAFTEPPRALCSNPYVVRQGDSVWRIAETQWRNPQLWQQIVQRNPILSEPGRMTRRENGWVYVMIEPGELLCGVNQNGEIDASLLNDNIVSSAASTPTSATTVVQKTFLDSVGDFIAKNWWWLLLLLGIGLLVWFLRELSKDPVRGGAPQITGGVNDQTVRDLFERRGLSRGFTLLPGSIVRGRGYGRMMVSYFGGTEHPRNLNGETVYRARARFDDGREEDVFMLQGCGNDIRYGGAVYRLFDNFRFVEDEVVVEPVSEPVAEEVPAQQPAVTQPASVFDGEIAPGMIRGHVQGPRSEGDTAVLEIEGASLDGLSFVLVDRKLKIRWVPDATE